MGIDRVVIVSIPKPSINKQFFIDQVRYDQVRCDRVRYDRVRNDRRLEMIGSRNDSEPLLKYVIKQK